MTEIGSASADPTGVMEEIAAIARDLGSRAVVQAVDAARTYRHSAKLQVLIVGLTGSGRATLANLLLGRDVLPASPIPKSPLGISIRFGEATSVTRVDSSGDRIAMSPSQVRALLLGSDMEGRVEIETPAELLHLCDLHIEPLDAVRDRDAWRDILASSDFVVAMLNAAALLSEQERRFVRDHLAPQVGLERVALLINRMDLVPEGERDATLELVHTFLGPFHSVPAILQLSLSEAARTRQGLEALRTQMDDLLAQREPLRAAGMRHTAAALIGELDAAVERLLVLYAMEAADVERVRVQLGEQQAWLQARVERTQRRLRARVQTIVRETLQRRIEGFGEALRNRLPAEIRSAGDLALARRHLPGYIETVWTDFVRRQMVAARGDLAAEEARVAEAIAADFQELLAIVGQPALEASWGMDAGLDTLHVFVMPRRVKRREETIARGLALNGLFLLLVAPQLGVLSLVASQALQRVRRQELAEAGMEALTTSAVAAARQVEEDIARRLDQQLETLAAQLEQRVAEAYRSGLEELGTLLDERMAHAGDVAARQAAVTAIAQERLPGLRRRIGLPAETPVR